MGSCARNVKYDLETTWALAALLIEFAPEPAEKVVKMDHREGLLANITTAMLVGVGANLGLPMSTTHVSTGAIAGIAGTDPKRLNRRTVRNLILAWTVTPLVAGLIAGVIYTVVIVSLEQNG